MTVLGLIAEYNPFHCGHKYHLEESISKTNSNFSIAVMSGSFLQRGEPSLVDKWTKAQMAIDNGVDLVLELPFIFSSQSAEFFAYGGIKLLNSLKIVDYISFGSETGELDPLKNIASILLQEPSLFRQKLKDYLSLGLSFPVARSRALKDYISIISPNYKNNYEEVLNKPNNILGIEYLKALLKINSSITPITIKRSGGGYKDLTTSKGFASATSLRNLIRKKGLFSVENYIPKETYDVLSLYLEEGHEFNCLENYNQILIYIIRTIEKSKLQGFLNIEPGLENRMINQSFKYNNIIEIIDNIVTKRYAKTRIQRLFIHLLHDLNANTFRELYKYHPSYIRVLGANRKGLELLNRIKKNSNIPIITKFADHRKLKDSFVQKTIMLDKRSTDMFFLGLKSSNILGNMDYFTSPYIVK